MVDPVASVPPVAGERKRRRQTVPIVLALAAVAILVVGALGTRIIKLPGGAMSPGNSPAGTGPAVGASSPVDSGLAVVSPDQSAVPSGPVESPPPIDHLATPATGALTLGDSAAVKAIQLGADGASTTVSAAGKPWDGLTIDVPAGVWPGATLQVTAQPITGASFGDLVTPISPLYTVSGAEGMAPLPVTLKIPATIPDDSFAMGFFYDGSGHLEGMPLLAEDGTSVTVATQHFSSWFASLVKKALLPKEIDSGFRPGVDDWQFTNWGSYVATGHCTGQVLSEAWYYLERQRTGSASHLYNLYDNNGADKTPYLWQDDSNGYRLAGVVQTRTSTAWLTTGAGQFFEKLRDARFDTLQYDAFRYAMAVTAEPQLVVLWDEQGGSTHAILAYRVAPSAIFIADPNYPAGLKYIPFNAVSGQFGTLLSGVNKTAIDNGHATAYTRFVYAAKTALVDWPALAADWAAFDAGTIGNGVFPSYDLEALAGKDLQGQDVWVPLVDGYRTAEKTLALRLRDPSGTDEVRLGVYPGTSSKLSTPWDRQVTVDLQDGANPLGIMEWGAKPGWTAAKYVNFVRLNVIFEPAASPSPETGGHWVLTTTTPLYGGAAKSWHNDFESLVVDSTNGRISSVWDTDGPPKAHVETSVSWGTPPPTSAPGGVWITNLTAEAPLCRGDGVARDVDITSVSAHVDWYAAAQDPRHDEWSAGVTCSVGKASTKMTWTFPAFHGLGHDFFDIVVQGTGYNEDTWRYSYQWQN